MLEFGQDIGIDLGTSNSATCVCIVDVDSYSEASLKNKKESSIVEIINIPITQAISSTSVSEKYLLPSVYYLPPENETVPYIFNNSTDNFSIGEYAKSCSTIHPNRVITSAKSWLCNHKINPKENILPWLSNVKNKISPFEISKKILEHLKFSIANYLLANQNLTSEFKEIENVEIYGKEHYLLQI